MKKNKIIGILSLGLIMVCGCNCKDDDENNNPNPNPNTNKLLGTWITDTPEVIYDTIVFTNDFYVKKIFGFDDNNIVKYQFSDDIIYFTLHFLTPSNTYDSLTVSRTFVLQDDSLIIHEFSYNIFALLVDVIRRDVTFTKAE